MCFVQVPLEVVAINILPKGMVQLGLDVETIIAVHIQALYLTDVILPEVVLNFGF